MQNTFWMVEKSNAKAVETKAVEAKAVETKAVEAKAVEAKAAKVERITNDNAKYYLER